MRSTLIIPSTPFRSSNLAIPPSPFTPQLPNSPPPKLTTRPTAPKIQLTVPPPPQQPLKWLWQCHCCARIYHLGTTRRCLDDGHYFCAGAPVTKRDRKTGLKVTRKSRACASEFDYQGWKAWGTWRRDVEEQRAAAEALAAFDVAVESDEDLKVEGADGVVPRPLFSPIVPQEGQWLGGLWTKKRTSSERTPGYWGKDCWNMCDYPSECRWGKKFGTQQTQAQAQVAVASTVVPSLPPPPPYVVSEPVAKDIEQSSKSTEKLSSVPATIEELPEAEGDRHLHEETSTTAQETTRNPTFDDLLENAKRRKRRSAGPLHSPLASNPVSPIEQDQENSQSQAASAHTLQKAFDDFEWDLKRSIGRASLLLNGFVQGLKGSGMSEEEKAEAFVKGLRVESTRKRAAKERENDGQSLSD